MTRDTHIVLKQPQNLKKVLRNDDTTTKQKTPTTNKIKKQKHLCSFDESNIGRKRIRAPIKTKKFQ